MSDTDEAAADHVADIPPFVPITLALQPAPVPPGEVLLLLVQARTKNLTSHGELLPRRRYVRVPRARLEGSERLSPLLPSLDPGQPLHAPVVDDTIGIDAVAMALELQAAPKQEQRRLLEHTGWQPLCALLQAAAWLGNAPLGSVCEAKLCALVRVDNVRAPRRGGHPEERDTRSPLASTARRAPCACCQVVALARAAERSSSLRLLTACFFLLRAYFCAETDEARPQRIGRGPPPRLTTSGVYAPPPTKPATTPAHQRSNPAATPHRPHTAPV